VSIPKPPSSDEGEDIPLPPATPIDRSSKSKEWWPVEDKPGFWRSNKTGRLVFIPKGQVPSDPNLNPSLRSV
jgi:hypothetical protein